MLQKNDHGNIYLYKPEMLPPGTVHLQCKYRKISNIEKINRIFENFLGFFENFLRILRKIEIYSTCCCSSM